TQLSAPPGGACRRLAPFGHGILWVNDVAKHQSGRDPSHSTKGLSVLAEIQSARLVIIVHTQADGLIDSEENGCGSDGTPDDRDDNAVDLYGDLRDVAFQCSRLAPNRFGSEDTRQDRAGDAAQTMDS